VVPLPSLLSRQLLAAAVLPELQPVLLAVRVPMRLTFTLVDQAAAQVGLQLQQRSSVMGERVASPAVAVAEGLTAKLTLGQYPVQAVRGAEALSV
jgi:hypothetical protein